MIVIIKIDYNLLFNASFTSDFLLTKISPNLSSSSLIVRRTFRIVFLNQELFLSTNWRSSSCVCACVCSRKRSPCFECRPLLIYFIHQISDPSRDQQEAHERPSCPGEYTRFPHQTGHMCTTFALRKTYMSRQFETENSYARSAFEA